MDWKAFFQVFLSYQRWLRMFLVLFVASSCTLQPAPATSQPAFTPISTTDQKLQATEIPTQRLTEAPTWTARPTHRFLPTPSLTATPWYTNFANLPPGQYVAYMNSRSEIFAIDISGKVNQKLTDDSFTPFRANGKQMLYVSGGIMDWETEKYELPKDHYPPLRGCEMWEISPTLDRIAAVCLEQRRVVLFSLRDQMQYILMGRDDPTYYFFDPQWSPDGKWLSVFLAYPFGKPNTTYLESPDAGFYLLDTSCLSEPSTCPEKQRGPFKVPIDIVDAYSWSPDSRFVASKAQGSAGFEIFDVQSGEHHFLQATNGSRHTEYSGPFCSPDGVWLAYIARGTYPDPTSPGIYLMPVADGKAVRLIDSDDTLILGWITVPLPMRVGDSYQITPAGADLSLRAAPSLSGTVNRRLQPGDQVLLLDGPVGADGYRWWKMQVLPDGGEGWAVEHPDWYEQVKP